jgi:hypothetical protein
MKILVEQPPRMSGLTKALLLSLVVHAVGSVVVWYYPLVATAIGFRNIEFVDEAYDRAILITFSKGLSYPPGYIGFRPPEKTLTLEEIAKREKDRRRRERARARERERVETSRGEAEREVLAEQQAKIEPTPAPAAPRDGYPGGFGKINTAPIRDQVQRLYESHKSGKLTFPDGKLRVGVSGRINADGTLTDCKVIMPSGLDDIDRAALAILDAVSASHALGPLHEMTSLSIVLNVGEHAELSVVGFTSNEQAAANIVNLANAALLYARFRKADDPAAMVIINNLKVSRSGQRVQAVVSMPRQKASESLSRTMGSGKT